MATAEAAPARKWAREYETIYILRPDVEAEAQEKVVDRVSDVIGRLGGTLTKLDNWGKRKLAYPIQKNNRGIFVYLKYVGFSDLVAELERNLRLVDEVVRFQTVLVRDNVDPDSVSVDPHEVQYLHVEEIEEAEDAELERARSLGMAPRATPDDEADDEEEDEGEEAEEEDDREVDAQKDADTDVDADNDKAAGADADPSKEEGSP